MLNKEFRKPPLTFYGGKQRLAEDIIATFPLNYQRLHYIEPFFGGGAVFFLKNPSVMETINDIKKEIFTLYKVLQDKKKFERLKERCDFLINDENLFKYSREILLEKIKPEDDTEIAFSLFYVNNLSMLGVQEAFAYQNKIKKLKRFNSFKGKVERLDIASLRLRNTQILNRDALDIIKKFDSRDSLFYLDPPYPEAHQGQYKGYTNEDFKNLVDVLNPIKGRFILSFYEKEWMNLPEEWEKVKFKTIFRETGGDKATERVECLAFNYEPSNKQRELF